MFTALIVGKFRTALGFDPRVDGDERKFMPLVRWHSPSVIGTLWTIEPVVASYIMRGNSTNVEHALQRYQEELVCIEPMSMTTQLTKSMPGNELRGRWAGWILWRDAIDNGGYTDAACMSCNVSSTLFGFSTQTEKGKLIHFVMTPGTVTFISSYARNMAMNLDVTTSLRTDDSTKLNIQPRADTNRATSLKLFGNGSMQVCGSPSDVELLVRAAFSIVKRALETEPYEFLKTMRQLKSFGN
ncbi:hypothetical protein AC578_1284 [Pseudocercospora eumusae]|uniref:Uncharacterized protein n=1 Tax=Pseudocercospora eumusae TaxID=321146 RepID=A0A139HU97_9PEZI|nr:hypothetical protein AC578_1284 [Pseudocercospora eumusae]